MRAYIYCSYKSSPAGFQIGTISHDAAKKNFYIPSKGEFNRFIIKAFEQNFIVKMYGLLPEDGKYIFLVKNLKQRGIDDPNEGMIDFYMNFAFEFDNFDDFNNFCGNFNELLEKGTAASECAKFIVPDRQVETFALKIDAEAFNSFIKEMLSKSDGGQVAKKIFVEVISAKLDESKLQETFERDFGKSDCEKKFVYPAEKKTLPTLWIGVGIIGTLILGIYLVTYLINFSTLIEP